MEPPRIWRLLTDGVGFFIGIAMIPGNILRLAMSWLGASRPAGVFPFRFRRQSIFPVVRQHPGFAVEFRELLTVLIRLLPAHRINRRIRNLFMNCRICACATDSN